MIELGLLEQVDESLSVKLGNNLGIVDFVGLGHDDSYWVVESQIVEAKKVPGEHKVPIMIPGMGEAMGQALLYSYLWKKRYPIRASEQAVILMSEKSLRSTAILTICFLSLGFQTYLG